MNFLYLLLIAVIISAAFILIYPFWKSNATACFGVGGALTANFFNIGTYPLIVGSLVFGLDSVLYSFFVFTVILSFLKENKKSAMNLMLSAVGAILFLTFVQLVATISSGDFSNFLWNFGSYIISSVATFLCIFIMLYFTQKLKEKGVNDYINIVVSMLIATVINSFLYFGLTFTFGWNLGNNFWLSLVASFIGKIITIGFACLTYLLINKIEKSPKIN
jgi:hypothetical protein